MSKTEKQKMLAGELYRPGDPELQADAVANKAWLVRYNAALASPVWDGPRGRVGGKLDGRCRSNERSAPPADP